MDKNSLRLFARTAAATKSINAAHSEILQSLLSLSNLKKQAQAITFAITSKSAVFPHINETTIENNVFARCLPLTLKVIVSNIQAITVLIKTEQVTQLQKEVSLLRTIAKEAASFVNRDHAVQSYYAVPVEKDVNVIFPRIIDTAANIDTIAGMYDRECTLLSFLVANLQISLGTGKTEDGSDFNRDGNVEVDDVIERWRTLELVDLVFEGSIMEIAKAAASAD
ncbi:hypothetical protein HK100_007957 [Physocladia obscura]|uniref:Uncharacterized protein n=1 Tax=Physocladia obscura TaxID=109957 RepID=A0AAD5T9H1_9FUNG|nr:hypothetical protein HK100_007957 [Physocladia obscura]